MAGATKGLGRGLDALLNARPKTLYRQGAGSLPISAIRRGTSQPRKQIREESLEELAASIKSSGVIQPIIVRPVAGFPHQFELIAGERRWQAAQLAGLADIPAVVREASDKEAVAIALIENIQREELTAAEEARALKKLIEEFGLTHEDVAKAVGRSRAAVSNLVRLLDLPAPVIALIDTKSISMGHARALLGLDDEARQTRVAMLVAERGLSVRQTEDFVRRTSKGERSAAPKASELSVVSEVLRTPTVRVQLQQRAAGKGKLIVEFADSKSRDAMLRAIEDALRVERQ
ncbi:MAG TPA: ParB/RepB/Spo0J family partition protein [Steroidobacteraceae bacterium]|jgi:ParB family chromosome partitioning protein